MAVAYKLSIYYSVSSSLYSPSCRQPISSNPNASCSFHCNSSSGSSSMLAEKHSLKRYQTDHWLYQIQHQLDPSVIPSCYLPPDGESIGQNNIALQLPELKKLLQVLREKRASCCGGDSNGERCGPGNVFFGWDRAWGPRTFDIESCEGNTK